MFPLAALPAPDGDEWPDENELVRTLRERIASSPPVQLDRAEGAWEEPYLKLCFRHLDGSALDVVHGDGYTAITGDRVDFHGGLSTEELRRVLFGIFDGTTRHVVRSKAGVKVTEHFEVGDDPSRIGLYSGGPVSLHRYALDKLLPVSARSSQVRLSFADAPE